MSSAADKIVGRFSGMEKKSSVLTDSLNVMWAEFGPRDGMEKNAGLEYFYDLQRDELDVDALGAPFCKLASSMGKDPWELSCEVEDNLDAFEVLSKTASDDQVRELAQFYVDWADEMEKVAAGAGLVRRAFGGIKRFFGRGAKARPAPKPGLAKPPATAGTPTRNVSQNLNVRGQEQAALKRRIMAKRQASGAGLQRNVGGRSVGMQQAPRTMSRGAQKTMRRQQIAAETQRRGMGSAASREMGATRQLSREQWKAMPKNVRSRHAKPGRAPDTRGEGMTFGQKALGATAIGVPLVGAGMLMNKQKQQSQQQYPQGAYYG